MLDSVRLFPQCRAVAPLVAGLAVLCAARAPADISIDRDVLTVTTNNLIAVFRGPDLFRLTNRLTNEQYLRPPTPFRGSLDMGLLEPTGRPLTGDFWRKGRNDQAAQFVARDLTRTVYLNVVIDEETQDITLTVWGESLKEGATGLTWGLRGLDLTGGRLVLPVQGGRYADESTPFGDMAFHYPGAWEAQMMIWEDRLNSGGFVVYSRDDELRYKQLHLSRHGPRVDVGFETEAHAPFKPNGSVKAVEWRINTYKGDWRVPATGYRNLMNFSRPPAPLKGSRAWVKDVRAVVSIDSKPPDPETLEPLSKTLDSKKTLLYVPHWRVNGYDPNMADYTARPGVKEFVERAHELGFHVMLAVEPPGWNVQSGDSDKVRRLLVKDAKTGKIVSDAGPSFANYHPARSFRDLMVARLKVMMDDVTPDVLLLPGAGDLPNDGNGLIDNRSFSEDMAALHRALLTAFPDMLLAADGMNELITPYSTVALRSSTSSLPGHPLSTLLFANSTFLASVPAAGADPLATLDTQGVFPMIAVSSEADLSKPDTTRLLRLARVWQDHDALPDWVSPLKGFAMRWRGADGSVILAEKSGDSVVYKLGNEVIGDRPLKPARVEAKAEK